MKLGCRRRAIARRRQSWLQCVGCPRQCSLPSCKSKGWRLESLLEEDESTVGWQHSLQASPLPLQVQIHNLILNSIGCAFSERVASWKIQKSFMKEEQK